MTASATSLIKYSVVGASNTLLGLGIIYVAWGVFGIGDIPANILGYLVGFLWSYTWNKLWTFRKDGKPTDSLWRYALICAFAYAANLAVLSVLRMLLGTTSFFPHVIGILVYGGLSYVGSCYFAFAKRSDVGRDV
jgi:putative flippase GtrA